MTRWGAQEFGEFARSRDVASGILRPFEMSYRIDGDKVDGRSVRFTLNKDDKWTQALKLMLTDLKQALAWLSSSLAPPPPPPLQDAAADAQ